MANVKTSQPQDILDNLRDLLLEGAVSTQEDIGTALIKQGHDVNQSKVSRMLRKIGAVKSKNEFGQIVYRLPKEPAPPSLNSQLASLIIDISCNENMIVINTSPGSASVISRLLDYQRDKSGILGTVAGDDTILVIPKSVKQTQAVLQEIKLLLRMGG